MSISYGASYALRLSWRPLPRLGPMTVLPNTILRPKSTSHVAPTVEQAASADPSFPTRIRTLMRHAPRPLTVIISKVTPDSPPSALLVSSFNTITISPTPIVSFNVRLPSTTYTAIQSSRHFTASVVDCAETANAFVSQQSWQKLIGEGEMLKEGAGGVVWFRCQLIEEKTQQVGDHVLIVAKVVDGDEHVGAGNEGLIYWRGKYRRVGTTIDI